ncbi:MAG: type IV secretion system DNA-binding domain-containing protein [Candidatus Woesebacteria bacterium]|jgi:hypothetical protein
MDSIFSLLLGAIGKWYIWLPIVVVLVYLAFRNNRRAKTLLDMEHTLLILEIPRTNDKKELAAEHMFASLHGILRSKKELAAQGGLQEHISFEIAAINKQIKFYVWVPKHLRNFVEGQIYAQYPTVQIHEADEDYAAQSAGQPVQHVTELTLTDNEVLPIKSFQSFEVDPLAGITATLAKLEESNEEMWIQILARPIADDWHKKSSAYISKVKSGKSSNATIKYLFQALGALTKPPEGKDASKAPELSERTKGRISEVEKKSNKLGYQVKIRIAYLGNDQTTARLRMQAIIGTFKQFNSTNLNGFKQKGIDASEDGVAQYRARFFVDRGYILNIEELASLFHFPHTNVETPSIVWASSKTAEPPAKLPVITGEAVHDNEVSAFGLTNFRGVNQQFGLYRSDRGRHVYIIGQTGAGKSGLLELFALSDVFHNQGYAIIDPHGDFAINNMRFIPASRIKDVVYFNPSDTAFPVGFNPMEVTNPALKNNISSEIIGVLKRMFGDSWGPRLEYILRYTILALLDYPDSTMLDITRMLTDKKFRKDVLSRVTDTVVLNFWNIEFGSWNDKFANEAIAPVLNKVGAFTANPIIRNIIGQPKSTFNIRQLMDEGKILIVNLSKGLVGEDNAAILGAFLVIKIQLAAMSRSDIANLDDRRPFYLYVDEFQNFATDSFATILSEARKYGLNLTVANQYVSQMQDTVRAAVFGNVGTTISFRVSADDAPILAKPFAPQFMPEDLLQMHNRHFIASMVIRGEKANAFSATTLTLPPAQTDFTPQIVENTRRQYARTRHEVEDMISEKNQAFTPPQQQAPQSQALAKKHPISASATPVKRFDNRPFGNNGPERPNKERAEFKSASPQKTSIRPPEQPQRINNQDEVKPSNSETSENKKRRRRGGKNKNNRNDNNSNNSQHKSPNSFEADIRLR